MAGATPLDYSEAPAIVALAAPLATAPALETDQALVHGLALPLVVDPDATLILVQVDRCVIAGLIRIAAVRIRTWRWRCPGRCQAAVRGAPAATLTKSTQ
jgi:hypothetical protein